MFVYLDEYCLFFSDYIVSLIVRHTSSSFRGPDFFVTWVSNQFHIFFKVTEQGGVKIE